jgi:DNA-binding SARP family transcriptional activator
VPKEPSSEPLTSQPNSSWSLTLLGGVTLSLGDRTVTLRNRKSQAILGYVALNPSRRATREQLAGLLWSESPEPQARASLRQALRGLRQVLDTEGIPGIVLGRDETRIAADEMLVDVWKVLHQTQIGIVDSILLAVILSQMFSTGLSSGDFGGSGIRVMLSGTASLAERCQPAWSSSRTACAPGSTA